MVKLKFHRNKKMLYILVIPEIYVDGKLVKTLSNGETYEYYVEEGEHEITVIAQIATIRRKINVQQNMEFNIDLHANSFDLEILNENGVEIENIDNNVKTREKYETQVNKQKISAKNDFKNKNYWRYVLIIVGMVAISTILNIVFT